MPDKRKHRGPNPKDHQLFAPDRIPALRRGLEDFTWLLSKGYPEKAALKLVGDHFRLTRRQRMALKRCACSYEAARERRRRQRLPRELKNQSLQVDGFNLLITIESALSGGFLFEGVDGCYRDLASIHGSYKRVSETEEAVLLIGREMEKLGISNIHWLLDQPVSNSGRLLGFLYELAEKEGWNWTVTLLFNPDQMLAKSSEIIVTSDSFILDQAAQWFNLGRYLVDHFLPDTRLIPLGKYVVPSPD